MIVMLPEWLLYPPSSTIFTMVIAFTISAVTTLLNLKLIDKEKMIEWQREIQKWNAERNLAKRTGDKKLLAKVRKKEPRILQIQSRMLSQRMRTSLITFIPLLIIWQILLGFFQNIPVARLPGLMPGQPIDMPFFIWYLVCSFFIGTLLSRISGVSMGMTQMGLSQNR